MEAQSPERSALVRRMVKGLALTVGGISLSLAADMLLTQESEALSLIWGLMVLIGLALVLYGLA